VAHPQDAALRGPWWELFQDPALNELEAQVNLSNQNIAAAAASLLAARAVVLQARAQYFPTLSTAPSVTASRGGAGGGSAGVGTGAGVTTQYSLPFDASWVPDLWGRVRNTVRANVAAAQVSAADLENTRLTAHAELAADYFALRGQDALAQLLAATVVAYRQALELTQALYETGIDSAEAVAQAETQLRLAEAQATNLGILRAQYEHAIAMLIGRPASSFALGSGPLHAAPPAIPAGLPSELLERRPDIAAAERAMAQANALIGVAQAAFYPNLTLSGTAGLASTALSSWFTWPARLWAVGASLAETLFDAGLRKATVQQTRAAFDQTVATYRQAVLTAFQQVEDNLASLRILGQQIQQQDAAVAAAQRTLGLAADRYKLGIDPYLNVITAQTTLLSAQQTAVTLRVQQLTASVQLVEALGGGWDARRLPSPKDLRAAVPASRP